jgi:hypothetical protein
MLDAIQVRQYGRHDRPDSRAAPQRAKPPGALLQRVLQICNLKISNIKGSYINIKNIGKRRA